MTTEERTLSSLERVVGLIKVGINEANAEIFDSNVAITDEQVLKEKKEQLDSIKAERSVAIKRFLEFSKEFGAKEDKENFERVFKGEIDNFYDSLLQLKLLIELLEYEVKNKRFVTVKTSDE